MTPPPIDAVSAATAIAVIIVGPALAPYIGPYFVVLLGAFLGSLMALRRRLPGERGWSAPLFVGVWTAISALLTVAVAEAIAKHLGVGSLRWFLAPVAITLSAIGDDWPAVVRWGLRLAQNLIERRVGGSKGDSDAT